MTRNDFPVIVVFLFLRLLSVMFLLLRLLAGQAMPLLGRFNTANAFQKLHLHVLDNEPKGRITHTQPQARLLVDVWLGLDEIRRQQLHSKPLAPTYLRAPFTSKAKPGHPLLRKG